MVSSKGIKITPVEGKNGLYRIEIKEDNRKKALTIPEISKIIRKPLPKLSAKK